MAVEFFIPKLGQTVEEVTIIDWLVKDGEHVEQGQSVLEVETDKAVFPVEANASGVIHLGPFKKGDVVPVITTVALIGKPDDHFSASATGAPGSVQTSAVEPTATPVVSAPDAIAAATWNATPVRARENRDAPGLTAWHINTSFRLAAGAQGGGREAG